MTIELAIGLATRCMLPPPSICQQEALIYSNFKEPVGTLKESSLLAQATEMTADSTCMNKN